MLKYTGGGILVGVPARDLSDEEVRRHGRARLIATGFYVEPEKGKPRPAENKQAAGPQESKGEV